MFDRLRTPFILFNTDEGAGASDTPPEPPATGDETDWQAEAEKWKALSRKWEGRAKENGTAAEKLAELERASQTDQEKAVADALARGRAEALRENAERVAAAELRAALTGVVKEPATVIENLNLSKFIGEDGAILSESVSSLRDTYAALAPRPPLDLGQGQGRNQSGKAPQLTRQQLKSMSPAEIVKAQESGQLDDLLGLK